VAIFVIILHDARHQLHSHLEEAHPFLGTHAMAKAVPKNIEALEPPVKCLLAILRIDSAKALSISRV